MSASKLPTRKEASKMRQPITSRLQLALQSICNAFRPPERENKLSEVEKFCRKHVKGEFKCKSSPKGEKLFKLLNDMDGEEVES